MSNSSNKEPVSVSMPSNLIEIMDDFCIQHDFNRSQLICRAVRRFILQKQDTPDFWERYYHERLAQSK